MLTDEERRTLIAEGYPIPQRFPLSKAEERSLKKIRRKIKNKISAQESRRKKKEYMEELEKKVQQMELKIVELERKNELMRRRQAAASCGRQQNLDVVGAQQSAQTPPPPPQTEATAAAQIGQSIKLECVSPTRQADDVGAGGAAAAPPSSQQAQQAQQPQKLQPPTPQRKVSIQSNVSATDDDHFIDDILMSQEEGNRQANDDLVANLVGVVCENEADEPLQNVICVGGNQQVANGRQEQSSSMFCYVDESARQTTLCSSTSAPLAAEQDDIKAAANLAT